VTIAILRDVGAATGKGDALVKAYEREFTYH